jgi:acyl transferase domain-containing protein
LPERAQSPIAVVGLGALFPGAPDVDTYWSNIIGRVDAITDVPATRLDPVYFDPSTATGTPRSDRFYCQRGGFVDDLATFDPTRFGIMPMAVESAEPDQLLALATAAAALDDAGTLLDDVSHDRIGVIVGRGGYVNAGIARLEAKVRGAEQLVESLHAVVPSLTDEQLEAVRVEYRRQLGPDRPEASIGLVPNLGASRIANRLDLLGPAYTIDAACASSLIAIDNAVRELEASRCDAVIAGGVHHCHDVTLWSVFSQLRALSPSGVISPFSAAADGILIGEGTGMVVLERLADAERLGHRVYAVVRGSGVASDGRDASLMSPRVEGQVLALERAYARAEIDPASVGLVEAHGTATPAGDRAELDTLRRIFGKADDGQPTAGLGSVKSMIGHAMPAAGAAGFIKAALAVHHGILPPTLHADEPNAALADTRFRLVREAEPWVAPVGGQRRAGVNAFGFGGINAHVILEEPSAERSVGSSAFMPGAGPVRQREPEPADVVALIAGRDAGDLLGGLDAPAPAIQGGGLP